MTLRALVSAAVLSALACSPASMAPPSPPQVPAEIASASCTSSQFVACESGPACARRQGALVHPKACRDKAASACDALSCEHGCNISHGTPKEVHCAPNASSSSHMKRCAGLANWACPEDMECDLGPNGRHVDDAMGTCVPMRM